MKHWIAPLFLLTLLVGTIQTLTGHASAQTQDLVRVLELSPSGYERAHALAFSPNGRFLAAGGTSGIYLFDTQQLSDPAFIRTDTWTRSLLFLPQTNMLAAGLFDNTIKFWGLPGLQLINSLEDPDGWVRSISISRDGSLLASASDDDKIRIWRTNVNELVLVLNDVSGVRVVGISPDGALVAGALADNTVRVWNVSNGKLLFTLKGHTDWARCLDFSPDGQILASGAFDNTIRMWDMTDGSLKQTLMGHTSSVLGVDFSPDGQILASGSIDQTILLWNVNDGEMLNMLKDHTDFVYAVAFSPDGKTLASGGGDNTVRLWNLEALDDTRPAGLPSPVSSDCRQCHHRRGQNEPARVIDLSCEACHAGGVGLSWCPAFPRSSLVQHTPIQYHATHDISGFPINDGEVAIVLASPGNGETFYVMNNFMSMEIISGRVYYKDRDTITKIRVQLDIISNGQVTASLTTTPTESGDFNFNVAINPESPPSFSSKPATRQCTLCHDDSLAAAGIPAGTVHFLVTATTPDGQQASDERWARVDSSGEAMLLVQVVDEETREPLPGLLVEASTILYEWRDRYGSGISDSSGNAHLKLEILSQAPTVYDIFIPPQILNGSLYSGPQATTITLTPNTEPSKITLTVRALKGQVNGTFNPSTAMGNPTIWAIHLPDGPVYKTTHMRAEFVFEDLPVGRYLLAADPFVLADHNLYTSTHTIDLFEDTDASTIFSLAEGASISGRVLSEDGSFLPFAWINSGGSDYVLASDPVSGKYLSPEPAASFATISVPGYYSLSQSIASLNKSPDFQLTPRPETQLIKWGNGQIVLPPETKGSINNFDVNLEYGWLWGENSESSQAIHINMAGMNVQIMHGQFALEYPMSGTGWLYVHRGEATITDGGNQAPIQVRSGEMIALMHGANPFPMESAVAMALHPPLPELPIPEVIEPSLGAKIQNWLTRAGIGLMQLITFITYILSLVTLITIISRRLFLKKKSSPTEEKP